MVRDLYLLSQSVVTVATVTEVEPDPAIPLQPHLGPHLKLQALPTHRSTS